MRHLKELSPSHPGARHERPLANTNIVAAERRGTLGAQYGEPVDHVDYTFRLAQSLCFLTFLPWSVYRGLCRRRLPPSRFELFHPVALAAKDNP